jgi:hypothetical protein
MVAGSRGGVVTIRHDGDGAAVRSFPPAFPCSPRAHSALSRRASICAGDPVNLPGGRAPPGGLRRLCVRLAARAVVVSDT